MLYCLDRTDIEASVPAQIANLSEFGLKEKDLENFLRSHLAEVVSEDHLMLIGQERAWQAEADLLALDKSGVLYIFELKRWRSHQENILQVLRYGQKFGRFSYSELEDLARRHGKIQGNELSQAHTDFFQLENPLPESDFNNDQVFVLVTNGVDADSISAVNYWSKKGVKIVCVPYSVYSVDGNPLISFQTYNPDGDVVGDLVVEKTNSYFIVNTNRSYLPDGWKGMINDGLAGKASAFYSRKYQIQRIPRKATVFLYHTGVGVIAKGQATSSYKEAAVQVGELFDKGEEFFVPLKFDWALSQDEWAKAPRASQINEKIGTSHRFRQTVFAIPQDMARAIDSIAVDRGVPGAKASE